ncbi:MAG: YkvA family protein [Gammaproteobacteria bacterium]|nr:YkvA family protein [Gammaproteobacteria bacterium]
MQIVPASLKQRAHHFKAQAFALYLAARDPRTPWYARLLVAGIVAYVLSPIDLIPDFVPLLGYLDDLILVPLGIALALKLIPRHVFDECQLRAEEAMQSGKPESRVVAAIIVLIWIGSAVLCAAWIYRTML